MSTKVISRKTLLPLLLFWIFFSPPNVLAIVGVPSLTENKGELKALIGLDRHYNLSFLWFDNLAAGQLSFMKDPSAPNRYRAVLDAKTLGVAAWLTGDRRQHYETLMEMSPQGRLAPLEYRSMIHKKKGGAMIKQSKLYTFDAVTRTIFVTRSREGSKTSETPTKILSKSFPVDFLTAGFNFILGADGPLRPGERKEILTFTDKGEKIIVIEVLRAEAWPATYSFSKGRGILLKIILPNEILDTGGGAVYALLDKDLLPQQVTVENVLGLGDVQGVLRP